MPDLDFHVEGVAPVPYAAAPTLAFKLRLTERRHGGAPPTPIQNVSLRCQLRLEPARRRYSPAEQGRLFELFGEPHRWGQTVRGMLWTHASVVVPPFTGETRVDLPVECSFDFNIAATKYFDALEDGQAPLCLLFSGTIFYADDDGALRVEQIPWEKEVTYPLPVPAWRRMMDAYYPNGAWLCLRKDVFDRLRRYKTLRGLPTWERAVESLLAQAEVAQAEERAAP